MKIHFEKVGKKYVNEWVFRSLTETFTSGSSYAITGPNGSGKSTLLQIISGFLLPTTGRIRYNLAGNPVSPEKLYKYISFSSPYLELLEEMTLQEIFNFHSGFKKLSLSSYDEFAEHLKLNTRSKAIRFFSSGMKQRVKLGLAVFSDTPVLLLDEPTTNLDRDGILWYKKLIEDFRSERLVVVSSNQPEEYEFCNERIDIIRYKRKPQKDNKQERI